MAMKTRYYVQTFGEKGKRLIQTSMRDFKTPEEAIRAGDVASTKHGGVLVFELESDDVANLWGDPRMLASHGKVPEEALT